MQFVKNGPDIPDALLQRHEEGRVVFFCGAGVSYPADLPGFGGLVARIYLALGDTPTSVEQTAIKRGHYDTAIGLIESRVVGGRAEVRKHIAKILTPDLTRKKATRTHEALLRLARTRVGRCRLITTNFDRLFEIAAVKGGLQIGRFEAPLLPVPKNRWDGLVYLHGLLPEAYCPGTADRLVVSSGDFGLAYLSERWAARFIGELFRNYTVCFVGYSIDDPVLRYMMDALAADKLLGERSIQVFAFGGYAKGQEKEKLREWNAKNVTPILYREHNHHALLHESLHQWSAVYRDGVSGKESIIVRHASTFPIGSTKEDDYVGRVLWALSDRSGLPAKRFADLIPAPPLDWLIPFSESRFKYEDLGRFGVVPDSIVDDKLSFSLMRRFTPYGIAPRMALVQSESWGNHWDAVMSHLARWLARHLSDPNLILWIVRQGGKLDESFAAYIRIELETNPPPQNLRTLWHLALSGHLTRRSTRLGMFEWRQRVERFGLTAAMRMELLLFLKPYVELSEPIRIPEDNQDGIRAEIESIRRIVDWDIELNTEDAHSILRELSKCETWRAALQDLLSDATSLLRDALDLMASLGSATPRSDLSYIHHPSISDHEQNQEFRDWTALIVLVRDSWLAASERASQQALAEIERWLTIKYPVFRRLVFFAATKRELIVSGTALDWLLADSHWWLWSVETRREAIRLLASLAPDLDSDGRRRLESAILQGPPLEMFGRSEGSPSDEFWPTIEREIWLRLAKYAQGGGELGEAGQLQLAILSEKYPGWRLADDQRDEFPHWIGTGEDFRAYHASPKHRRELAIWLRGNAERDSWEEDDWQERCRLDFPRAASALLSLAKENQWPAQRWREALQVWGDEKVANRSWRYLSRALDAAPDTTLKDIAHALSWWLEVVAKKSDENTDIFFSLIERLIETCRDELTKVDDDPVFKAINHPIGQATQAALRWWFRQSPKDDQGLPGRLKALFGRLSNVGILSFVHGRVLMAAHAIALFRVDQAWTRANLLPFFDWEKSTQESRAAWEGFLWSPRLYPPLLEAMKVQFLETARHFDLIGKHGKEYAALLTFAALELDDLFTRRELADATRVLPPSGLARAAQALYQALEAAGEQREQYWLNRILPYLRSIWPKSQEVRRPSISEGFARICIATGNSFPSSVDELRSWLQPINHPDAVIGLLKQGKLCDRFPASALTLLDLIIGEDARWLSEDFGLCLNAIASADSSLESDPRYIRLLQIARLQYR